MPLPVSLSAFWIFEPGRVFAGETDYQNIVPAVFVEVVGPDKEIIRIRVLCSESAFISRHRHGGHRPQLELEGGFGGIILVLLFEIWALPPPGTGNKIVLPVIVEIAKVCPFAPELIIELNALEGVHGGIAGHDAQSSGKNDKINNVPHTAVS